VLHSHKSSQLSSSTPLSPPSTSRGNTSPPEKESVKSTAQVPPSTPQCGECFHLLHQKDLSSPRKPK
jgi:hypothetical protein